MAPTLPSDQHLGDRIVAHLKRHTFDSISGIARAVSHGQARPTHRLTVAGYLQAMHDAGALLETERPPSKVYRLANPDTYRTAPQRVGRVVRELGLPASQSIAVAVAALSTILARPVFGAELRQAGFDVGPQLERVSVDEEARRRYRALASTAVALPRADPLLAAPDAPSAWVGEALRRVVLEATGAGPQAAPHNLGAQSHLDVAEGP